MAESRTTAAAPQGWELEETTLGRESTLSSFAQSVTSNVSAPAAASRIAARAMPVACRTLETGPRLFLVIETPYVRKQAIRERENVHSSLAGYREAPIAPDHGRHRAGRRRRAGQRADDDQHFDRRRQRNDRPDPPLRGRGRRQRSRLLHT